MLLPKIARLKLTSWLIATATVGCLPFGLTPSAQAQTVIYNGRTIIEDHDRYEDDDRYDRYGNSDRYDNYDRYDNRYDNRSRRYERYDNYDRYDDYDNDERYDNYDHYDRYGRSDRRDRYDNYDRYDHYDHYDHDGYSRRPQVIVVPARPSTGQSNPACLAFESIRVACRR
jgi:hypothetical protein